VTGAGRGAALTPDEVLAQRMAAQLLSGPPARDPVAVTERLLAVQGQDPRGVRLAIRSRSRGLTAADVDAALTTDRSLIVTWVNRGTLHLVRAEDYWWLHDLTTPQLATGNARRLAQEGVSPDAAERGVAVVERALASDGPLTRAQLRERVSAAGVRTEGQALVHVLLLSCLRGLTVRGPVVGREQAFVLTRDWLGPRPARSGPDGRDAALTELARRYLAGHGPATDRDLAKWANLPLRDVRRGLTGLGGRLTELGDGLVRLPAPDGTDTDGAGGAGERGWRAPRLLGAFDPVLLGWVSREQITGAQQGIVTVNGLFRPFAMVNGRAVALWSLAGGDVELRPFAPLPEASQAALAAEAADVRRFLGLA
jgi:hypothetical protein